MAVIPTLRNPFPNVNLQFMKSLIFEDDSFYELEFKYKINYDICTENKVKLTFYLLDTENFKEILFESTYTTDTIENNKWNSANQCFRVYNRIYYLHIQATSLCEFIDNKSFIAVDEVVIRKLDESSLDISSCKDFRITERPPVEETISEIKHDTTDSSTKLSITGTFELLFTTLSTDQEINTELSQTMSENTLSYQTEQPESTKSPDNDVNIIYNIIAIIVFLIPILITYLYCYIVKPILTKKRTVYPMHYNKYSELYDL